ncbi:MAG TPA: hypothetical protein VN751_02770 [Solirubrobacteraceae bacterium]|jgi:hypothetical protein|nr:hypothetical protein [Solirubrobacteraceae bacterium]
MLRRLERHALTRLGPRYPRAVLGRAAGVRIHAPLAERPPLRIVDAGGAHDA